MKKLFTIVLGVVATGGLIIGLAVVARGQGRRGGRGGGFFRGGDRSFFDTEPNQPIGRALPQVIEAPADDPITPAKVALGRLLFWDPILSGDKDVACATCHHPQYGYTDGRDISVGVNGVGLGPERKFASPNSIPFVERNSPTVVNTAFNGIDQQGHYNPSAAAMFWDSRAQSLEAQAVFPIKTFEEMRGNAYPEDQALERIVARLAAIPEYRSEFAKAFGGAQPITSGNLAKALATFERSLVANNSPFDRYMRGDTHAMTDAQIRGMQDFQRIGCTNCHSGPMFSDYKLHVLGVPDNDKLLASDRGANQTYAFRTASLRNLAYTAPYMHDGVFPTLEDVLRFYSGGRGLRNPDVDFDQRDPLLRRLRGLRGSQSDILEFLAALNDDSFDKTMPARIPSGLQPGGRINLTPRVSLFLALSTERPAP
jgi:cytochrome c peroxidase